MTGVGKIPIDWKISSLHDLCELIKDGTHNPPVRKSLGIPLLSATNIENGKIDFLNDVTYISENDYKQIQKFYSIRKGDILITVVGTLGRAAIVTSNDKFSVQRSIAILRPRRDLVNNDYFFQVLNSSNFKGQIKLYSKSTAQTGKYLAELAKLEIPLPHYIEQQKIAKILSDTDSLIESLDKLITKKKNIKQGLMQTLLTRGIGHTKFKKTEIGEIPEEWGTAIASDIYYIVTGTTPSTAVKEYWDQGKIEWFTPKDLRYVGASFSIFTSERKITEKAMTENSLTLLPLNSIVLSTRAPVGYVGINTKEATFNQGCKGLVPKQPEIVNTRFHAFYISHISNLLNTLSGGSTFKELSKETLGNITLPLPENGEQQEISNILSDADKEIEVLEQKRDKYKMLKTGMMQQLLTGGIRVK